MADWYERADAVREMADGSTNQAEADCHPDPLAETIRWQICEGELIQIIGRARGVNRTAADPVDVLVLTDVPLPMPLAGVLDTVDLTPGPADHMMAAGGVILETRPTQLSLTPSYGRPGMRPSWRSKEGSWGPFPIEDDNAEADPKSRS